MLNRVTRCYVEQCLTDPALRQAVSSARYPRLFDESYRRILLARPAFVQVQQARQAADDLAVVFRLLASLPRRLFGGDMASYCRAAGIGARLKAVMTRGGCREPALFGRSDAYLDPGFALLELNVGTELGGIEFSEMNAALLDVPSFHQFACEHRLSYVNTADLVASQLTALASPLATGDRPVVALLETTGGIAAHPNFRSVQQAMVRRGIDFRLAEVQEVRLRSGRLELGGTPVDVAMRFFAAGEILDCPYGASVLDPILAARDAGGTVLFTGLENSLYNTKGALALLSDQRFRSAFTPAETEVIDRVIPWTRLLASGWTSGILDYAREHREELVIKPCVGWSGAGTAFGRDVDDRAWARLLTERDNKGFVLQRVVVPILEPVCDPVSGRLEPWVINWGMFITPHGYSGTFARGLRPADGHIITFGNRGTRATCVFEFAGADGPDGPEPAVRPDAAH